MSSYESTRDEPVESNGDGVVGSDPPTGNRRDQGLQSAALRREEARRSREFAEIFNLALAELDGSLRESARWIAGNESDGDDLVQNLYLKLRNNYSSLAHVADLKAYCRRALRNLHIDLLRQVQRTPVGSLEAQEFENDQWQSLAELPAAPEDNAVESLILDDVLRIASEGGLSTNDVAVLQRLMAHADGNEKENLSPADRKAKGRAQQRLWKLIDASTDEVNAYRIVARRISASKGRLTPHTATADFVRSLSNDGQSRVVGETPTWLAGLSPDDQAAKALELYESARAKALNFFKMNGQ